jgi:hypothetical protein
MVTMVTHFGNGDKDPFVFNFKLWLNELPRVFSQAVQDK